MTGSKSPAVEAQASKGLDAPRMVELPSQAMAVVYTRGEPRAAADEALPALYGSVYLVRAQMKRRGTPFKVEHLRARWPDAHLVPKERWTAIFGLPIPDAVVKLPQKKSNIAVVRETWDYGAVAEVLHVGSYAVEGVTVRRLHDFIARSGYEICGSHEEVYLTTRRARVQKTLIRYRVRPRADGA